jgi:hypothetical protein
MHSAALASFSRGSEVARMIRTMGLVKQAVAALVLVGASVAVTGCVHVAPYERGVLAGPTMAPDDMSSGIDEHVRAVSEGATGGFGGGGGGCGCN